jgi:hypothetical protein
LHEQFEITGFIGEFDGDDSQRMTLPDPLHSGGRGTGIFAAGDIDAGTQRVSIGRDLDGDCDFTLNLHYTAG